MYLDENMTCLDKDWTCLDEGPIKNQQINVSRQMANGSGGASKGGLTRMDV